MGILWNSLITSKYKHLLLKVLFNWPKILHCNYSLVLSDLSIALHYVKGLFAL